MKKPGESSHESSGDMTAMIDRGKLTDAKAGWKLSCPKIPNPTSRNAANRTASAAPKKRFQSNRPVPSWKLHHIYAAPFSKRLMQSPVQEEASRPARRRADPSCKWGRLTGRMDAAVGQVSGSDVLKNAEKRFSAAFSPGNFFRSGAGRYDFNSGVRERHSTEPEISPPERTLAFDAMHYSHRSFRLRGPSQYIMNEITEDLIERFVAFPESLGETVRERVAAALQADRAAREVADFYRAYYKEYRGEGSPSWSDEAERRRSDPSSETLNGRSPAS